MSDRLRVGLVGTGWVAHQHATGYRQAAGDVVEITAACDPRAEVLETFCDRHEVPRRFARAEDLIASGEVDVLALLTPPAVRDEVIDPALAAGLHLLVEKPFATTGARAVRYTEAAESAGVRLAVGQNFRWFPEYQWLDQRLDRPDAGSAVYLEARSFQDRRQRPGQWRAEEHKLEMAIFSVHLIDRLQWLARTEPVTVSARTRRGLEAEPIPGEQLTALLVTFDGGVIAHLTSTWLARSLPVNDFRIDTTTGSAVVQRPGPMAGDARARADFGSGPEEELFPDRADDGGHASRSYGLSMRELATAVREGREPRHSGRDNLRTMGIMEAAYLSAARGGEVVGIEEALA
ncbi:Gfo/Idh/MocA family protein [Georgenia deserti]|uniref:Gfo/Idh/MocA family protein n=1 Tax=Georgenia deserti TaxID=2093781 RepID=A0ABW4L8Q7_9MICO